MTTAKRSNRLSLPTKVCPVVSSMVSSLASFRFWKRKPSWMLMLCFDISKSPDALPAKELDRVVLEAFEVGGAEPSGHPLPLEPGLLPLGVPSRRLDRLGHRLLEGARTLEMPQQLSISDGLECRCALGHAVAEQASD